MGNPAHLEELLKGVDHWNRWREEQGSGFQPDFSDMDIRKTFLDAGLIDRHIQVPLHGANFSAANFREANLGWCSFRSSEFYFADLSRARISGSDFSSANVHSARFHETVAVSGVGVQITGGGATNHTIRQTDLSGTSGLTQDQLESMLGDSHTMIPQQLRRPDHWPQFQLPSDEPDPAPHISTDRAEASFGDFSGTTLETPTTVAPPTQNDMRPQIKQRTRSELRATLSQYGSDSRALAQAMVEQVQGEIALHAVLAIPNDEDALNAHNARGNFLTEMVVALEMLHHALPDTTSQPIQDEEVEDIRSKLLKLAEVCASGVKYLDENSGTPGNLWRIGVIAACTNVLSLAIGAGTAIALPVAAGVVGASTIRLIVRRDQN